MGKNKKDLNEEIEESNIDSEESNIDSEENDSNVVAPDIDNFSISKHQIDGKHSLKYDTIFKGKKEEINEDEELSSTEISYDTIELDKSSSYYSETNDNETYFRTKKLKEKVYQVLDEHTKVDFKVNRRKPSKVDFNSYICILKKNLSEYNFTNVEIFNELSFL